MSTIDSSQFRHVLGHFPTGVTVVTAHPDEGPVGMAVGSFTSVSLDPPLVAFLPGKNASAWPGIEAAGHYCVNILSAEQADLSGVFSSKVEDRFANVDWTTASTGAPVIAGSLAWIDCEIEAVYEAGDHWIVLGRVVELDASEDGAPLLFFKGGYGRHEPLD
jgi:3-hydroxy-9,10-secoandrosta-1,3,5(10)-triene-9,17-dione monooxygenase reductase component